MTSIDRKLAGVALHLHLENERKIAIAPDSLERSGRNARTLIKEGPLRITLVALAAGGGIPPHHADGPIAIQTLDGSLRVQAAGGEYTLQPGDLLSLPAGVEHSVASDDGATFLLTIVLA